MHSTYDQTTLQRIQRLNAIGIALSAQRDHAKLLEMILSSAREITSADAGTLYIVEPDGQNLRFAIVQNNSLKVNFGEETSDPDDPGILIPLYNADKTPNLRTVSACAVLTSSTINIADAYNEIGFDFSGTHRYDKKSNYRSTSFLTVPLIDHDGEVIAALQLINKLDNKHQAIPFSATDQEIAESLASQAAVALSNQRLITELRTLFDSFTRVLGAAIDAKSPHTGAHCRRVPDATLMLAEAANGANFPGLEGFVMSKDDMYELQTAAWLHDCGKVVTPHHIMEKSTKLETVVDRIHYITQRFDILIRDIQLERQNLELNALRQGHPIPTQELNQYDHKLTQLADDRIFLERVNIGSEAMADADIQRLSELAQLSWTGQNGDVQLLLNDDELLNLSTRRGTLNSAERQIMEDHMVHTLDMLNQLPFPRHLKRVTEYAVGHHERMDGKGYPRGLTRDQLSIPARMMGIADVFEALTAHERPYKKPMPLSQALTIMGNMVVNQHLDPDLFTLFVHKKVYLTYAEKHLRSEQIDAIDLNKLPGLVF